MSGIASFAAMSSRALGALASPGYWMSFIDTGQSGHCTTDKDGNIYYYGLIALTKWQLVKFSPSGTKLWSINFLASAAVRNPAGLCTDSSSNTYVANSLVSSLLEIVKLDSSGNLLNRIEISLPAEYNTLSAGSFNSIAVDSSNNLYLIGNYEINSNSKFQSFIHKYSAVGNLIWQQKLPEDLLLRAIVPDSSGNLYAVGRLSSVDSSVFALKLNFSGTVVWQYSGNFSFSTGAIASDTSDALYFVGPTAICKIDSTGTLVWSKSVTFDGNSTNPQIILTDKNNNVYTAYQVVTASVTTPAVYTGWAKHDSNSNLQWSRTLTNTLPNSSRKYSAPGRSGNLDVSSNLIYVVESAVCATPFGGIRYYGGPVKFPPNGGEIGTYSTLVSSGGGSNRTIQTTYAAPTTVVDVSSSGTWTSTSYVLTSASLTTKVSLIAVSATSIKTYLTQV